MAREAEGRHGPLTGVRIVEFEAIGPVPLAGMILADLGADVVRVVRPGGHPVFAGVGAAVLGRNRAEAPLDLKTEAGRAAAMDLVARADGVLEGLRPGAMERLGLGPEDCLGRRPSLVYARVTGWGQTGERATTAGHDITYLAGTGLLDAIGHGDRPPVPPLNLVADYAGGSAFAVIGLLAALIAARDSGRGQVVDVAMTEGLGVLGALFHALDAQGLWAGGRGGNLLDGGAPFYRCYACRDGGHVAVGALEPVFFAQLVEGLGLTDRAFVQMDPAGWPAMAEAFAKVFATRDRDDWAARFAATDACVAPVLTLAEARAGYAVSGGAPQPPPTPRFSATPTTVDEARRRTLSVDEALWRWA